MTTRDLTALSREDVLGIPLSAPERLFTGDALALKHEFRIVAGIWHPDRPGGDGEVFAHALALREIAEARIAAGTWGSRGVLRVGDGGRELTIPYARCHAFELGHMYIADQAVTFAIEEKYLDLHDNGLRSIAEIKYADEAMRREHTRHVPKVIARTSASGRFYVTVEKPRDFVLLRDLLDYSKDGRLDARHAAWITSGLLNVACYFSWAGIVHGDISPGTVYVSPANHSVSVLGGWWYASRGGRLPPAVPTRTFRLCYAAHAVAKKTELAKVLARVDGELVRATGRDMLGDPHGSRLAADPKVPRPMADWLRSPASANPITDYDKWHNGVIPASFGARRFAVLDVQPGDVYA